jgi:GTPase SAR1 family protein
MCLVLGPRTVGKTLLLKRLASCSTKEVWTEVETAPATIATVGTNLVNISVGKKADVILRELGGSMSPVWPTYYTNCSAVMFVIDVSNRQQVAASCVLLLQVLNAVQLQQASLLIVLNKCDVAGAMTRTQLQNLMRLDDIVEQCSQRVDVVQCSAMVGGCGLIEVMQWIYKHVNTN